jgi:hypothetical protein
MDRRTDRRMGGQMDRRTERRMGGQMDRRTDRRTDGQTLQIPSFWYLPTVIRTKTKLVPIQIPNFIFYHFPKSFFLSSISPVLASGWHLTQHFYGHLKILFMGHRHRDSTRASTL